MPVPSRTFQGSDNSLSLKKPGKPSKCCSHNSLIHLERGRLPPLANNDRPSGAETRRRARAPGSLEGSLTRWARHPDAGRDVAFGTGSLVPEIVDRHHLAIAALTAARIA